MWHLLATTIVGAAGVFAWWKLRADVEGTTLLVPWMWGGVTLGVLLVSEMSLGLTGEPGEWTPHLRFWAAAGTIAPVMSLLGAKRPQDRAWQFVVVGLWVTAIYPSAQGLLVRPGEALELHPAQQWFLLVLVSLTWINGLPTRYWLSAGFYGVAQCLLLNAQLPWGDVELRGGSLAGLTLLVGAVVLRAADFPRAGPAAPLDRLWLDFRDHFGLLWGLRVADRFNAAAAMYDWDIRLSWQGFVTADLSQPAAFPLSEAAREAHAQVLENLLGRFVSPAWMAARLGE